MHFFFEQLVCLHQVEADARILLVIRKISARLRIANPASLIKFVALSMTLDSPFEGLRVLTPQTKNCGHNRWINQSFFLLAASSKILFHAMGTHLFPIEAASLYL